MSTNSPPPPNGGSGRLAAAQQSALQSDDPSAVRPCPLRNAGSKSFFRTISATLLRTRSIGSSDRTARSTRASSTRRDM